MLINGVLYDRSVGEVESSFGNAGLCGSGGGALDRSG